MKSVTGRSRATAFTLLELLVVVFLISLLSAGAVMTLGPEDEERALEGASARLSSLARRAHREAAHGDDGMVIVFDLRGFNLIPAGRGEDIERIAGHEVEGDLEIRVQGWDGDAWEKADGFRWEFPPLGVSRPLAVRFLRGGAGIEVSMDPLTGAIKNQVSL